MPYFPASRAHAWCDHCEEEVPLSWVGFDQFGNPEKPVLCPGCAGSEAASKSFEKTFAGKPLFAPKTGGESHE